MGVSSPPRGKLPQARRSTEHRIRAQRRIRLGLGLEPYLPGAIRRTYTRAIDPVTGNTGAITMVSVPSSPAEPKPGASPPNGQGCPTDEALAMASADDEERERLWARVLWARVLWTQGQACAYSGERAPRRPR